MRNRIATEGERRGSWTYDGHPDHLTIDYVERGLGGNVAAILLLSGEHATVQFDPRVCRPRARHLLRLWALRHIAAGWCCAVATAADVAPLVA